jgi:hypothetical protein
MEKKVLTQEEIESIKNLRSKLQDITYSLGQLEIQLMDINLEKEKIKSIFTSIQKQEKELAEQLEEKYGKGTISLDTGEFLPI